MQFKIQNADNIARVMAKSPSVMSKHLDRAMNKAVLTIHRESAKRTPVDTGRLRASHNTEVKKRNNMIEGRIFTQTNYDIFVHEGTKFMRARPFMKQAIDENEKTLNQFFTDSVDNAIKELVR